MKTILKGTLLLAFVAFVNSGFAIGNLKVNIQPISAEKALVAISSLTNSELKISVEDNLGRIVYYKEVAEPSGDYQKVFNFSDLDKGLYQLTVVSDKLTTKREFEIDHGEILVGDEKTTLEPFFSCKDGLLRCSYMNFCKDNLTLYFFENRNLIYTKEIGRNFNVNQAFSLAKLSRGSYTAVLSTGEKDYTYDVEIK